MKDELRRRGLIMATKRWGLAAYAIIRNDEGECVVLKRSGTSKTNAGKWELPGGKLEPGERFEEALLREVGEETGLTVALNGLAGAVEYEHPTIKVVCLVMDATVTSGSMRLSSEHDAYVWADEAALARLDLVDHFRLFFQSYKGITHSSAE
jgi:8-oxo-dGTP diphosphatase